jgi:hypothetical protein
MVKIFEERTGESKSKDFGFNSEESIQNENQYQNPVQPVQNLFAPT